MYTISIKFTSREAAVAALKAADAGLVSTDQDGGDRVVAADLDPTGARFDVMLTDLFKPTGKTITPPTDGPPVPPMPELRADGCQVDIYWQGTTPPTIEGGEAVATPAVSFDPPASPVPEFSVDAVKTECGRRIYAVASDSAQKNMLANVAAGKMSASDKRLFNSGVEWIASMQEVCRSLATARDVTFAKDSHWPEPPPGVADLASRY